MKKTIVLLAHFFLLANLVSAQAGLNNVQYLGQRSRNQAVGRGFFVHDTCMIGSDTNSIAPATTTSTLRVYGNFLAHTQLGNYTGQPIKPGFYSFCGLAPNGSLGAGVAYLDSLFSRLARIYVNINPSYGWPQTIMSVESPTSDSGTNRTQTIFDMKEKIYTTSNTTPVFIHVINAQGARYLSSDSTSGNAYVYGAYASGDAAAGFAFLQNGFNGFGTLSPTTTFQVGDATHFKGVQLNTNTPVAGYVFTTDASANATWQPTVVTDSIHVTSAQLLGAGVTPVQLEPGIPGHNYQILSIREDYHYLTSAYTGNGITITQDNSTTGSLFSDLDFINSTESGTGFLTQSTANGHPNAIRGDALTLYGTMANGAGSVDIFVTYLIR